MTAVAVMAAPDTSSGVDKVVGWGGGGMAPGPGAARKPYQSHMEILCMTRI